MRTFTRTFRKRLSAWQSGREYIGARICVRGLAQTLAIPANCNKIVAVFSDEKPDHNNFWTLCYREARPWFSDRSTPIIRNPENRRLTVSMASVREYRGQLHYETRRCLHNAYCKGFRYVWFEYEE